MRYETGGAFRMALEARLRAEAIETRLPLARLRKTVAFDRLLARMMSSQHADRWLLKGGLALQLRMHTGARTTKDVDVLLREVTADARELLMEASRAELGDWFEFEVGPSRKFSDEAGVRVPVHCRLDSREFEAFHVDIGLGDPVVEAPELLAVTSLLDFSGIEPTMVRCYPLSQHLAEKIHALTRPHGKRENSRVKDLVDVVIIAERMSLDARQVVDALEATFAARQTHSAPSELPQFARSWGAAYARMAVEAGVEAKTLAEGVQLAERFLNPILGCSASGRWNPADSLWR